MVFASSLLCYISLILHILNHPSEPGMNPTQLRCMIFFMYCWIQCANIFLRIFAYIFIKDIDLIFFFWWCPCLVLVSGWWWLHRMSLGVFFLFSILGEFEKGQYKFFVCLVEFAWEVIWSWTFVFRGFLKITHFISLYWLVCSSYLFLLDSDLVGCLFLETCPFL